MVDYCFSAVGVMNKEQVLQFLEGYATDEASGDAYKLKEQIA